MPISPIPGDIDVADIRIHRYMVVCQVGIQRPAGAPAELGLFHQPHTKFPDDATHQLAVTSLFLHQFADTVGANYPGGTRMVPRSGSTCTSTNTAPSERIENRFLRRQAPPDFGP
jgi:hypothetical protein